MKSPESPKRMRTWRDIPQNVTPRAMSRVARRRQWLRRLRWVGFGCGLVALCVGVLFVAHRLAEGDLQLARASNAEPIREVVLRTDGVLDQAWIMRRLGLPPETTLIDLDLAALRERLLADRQVITATLTRKFPATLEVSLSERSPVARINVRSGGPETAPRPQLVARDGVVYPGNGYDARLLSELPWIGGVRLRRLTSGTGGDPQFAPIFGMPLVAELLATARNEAPALYRTWRVVSLARLEGDAEIEVKTDTIERIIFNARESAGFLRQVAQLDLLLDSVQPSAVGAISEINLAIGRMVDGRIQVPVTFKEGVGGSSGRRNTELIAPVPSPRHQLEGSRSGSGRAPNNSLFFHPTRPSAREF